MATGYGTQSTLGALVGLLGGFQQGREMKRQRTMQDEERARQKSVRAREDEEAALRMSNLLDQQLVQRNAMTRGQYEDMRGKLTIGDVYGKYATDQSSPLFELVTDLRDIPLEELSTVLPFWTQKKDRERQALAAQRDSEQRLAEINANKKPLPLPALTVGGVLGDAQAPADDAPLPFGPTRQMAAPSSHWAQSGSMTDQYGTAPDVPFAPTPAPGITPTMPMLPVSPAISGVVPSTPAQDLMRRGTGLAFNQKMPIDSLIKLLPALASATNAASDIDPMQTTAGGYLDMQGNFVANQGPTLPAKQAIEQNKTNVDFAKNGPKQSERSLWNVAARKFENVKLLDTQAPPPGYVTDDQVVTVWDAWGNEKTRGQKVTITREEMLRNPDRYLDLKDKPVPYVNAQGKTVPKYPWEVTANDAANKRALDQADLNLRTRKTEADIASDKDRNNIARTQANTASAVASANIKHLQAETQQLLRAPGAAKGASGNAGRNTGRELSQKMALALDIRAKGAVEDSKGKITAWRTPNAEADYRRAMLDWRDATIAELHRQAPSVIVDGQLLKPGVEQDAWVNTRLKMMKFPENF